MATKTYEKSTSARYDATPPPECQEANAPSGVDGTCSSGCVPGVPNFTPIFRIVTSVNGMTGDVVVDTDSTYIHRQMTASSVWTIVHSLGRFPSVTVVDSGGNTVIGDVTYVDENTVVLTFQGAFSGIAYLN